MKKVLIINYYGSDARIPGGKRTALWQHLLNEHKVSYEVFFGDIDFKQKSFFRKIYTRLKFLIFSKSPEINEKWLEDAKKKCTDTNADYILICCPVYEALEVLNVETNAQKVVDIRDGIYFESLYTGFEKYKYKNYLLSLESKLKLANYLITNGPGLQRYYGGLCNKNVSLLYNQMDESFVYCKRSKKNINLLYAGGLMRSSWGQNLFSLTFALRNLRKQSNCYKLDMIGRFNLIEKLIYKLIYPSISFKAEVSNEELKELAINYDGLIISNTTKRDLLPSKIWFYKNYSSPIISINPSYSLREVTKYIPGVFTVNNDIKSVVKLLSSRNIFKQYDRSNIKISDDKDSILSIFR